MIERAYAAQQKTLAVDEHDRLFALFLDHYGANIPGQSQPYPGVLEALDRFAAAGYLLGRLHQQDRGVFAQADRGARHDAPFRRDLRRRTPSRSASPTRAI